MTKRLGFFAGVGRCTHKKSRNNVWGLASPLFWCSPQKQCLAQFLFCSGHRNRFAAPKDNNIYLRWCFVLPGSCSPILGKVGHHRSWPVGFKKRKRHVSTNRKINQLQWFKSFHESSRHYDKKLMTVTRTAVKAQILLYYEPTGPFIIAKKNNSPYIAMSWDWKNIGDGERRAGTSRFFARLFAPRTVPALLCSDYLAVSSLPQHTRVARLLSFPPWRLHWQPDMRTTEPSDTELLQMWDKSETAKKKTT